MVEWIRAQGLLPRLVKPLLYTVPVVFVPLLVGVVGLEIRAASLADASMPPSFAATLPKPPAHDPARKTAVVLSSAYGAEITDFLPPYEVLARSGAFNVYAVAPERRLLPLVNANLASTGLDFVPHYSFAEYDVAIGKSPDLIAIPYFPGYGPERDAAVVDWIRAHAGPGTVILAICAGTETLADTGLLGPGATITTNTGWHDRLESRFPDIELVRDVRYADDGRFITSTNLASGIDATLRAVDRLAGRAVADDVARQLGYARTDYLDDPSFHPTRPRLQVTANLAFQWGWHELGVVLYDGVSELALAALIDPYTSSLFARTHLLAPERTAVTSRHGLTFVPRHDFRTAPRVDRVLLPGGDATANDRELAAAWALARGLLLEDIHANAEVGEFAYDATLKDLARARNAAFAAAVGQVMFVPVEHIPFGSTALPLDLLARPLALGLLVLGGVLWFGRGRATETAKAVA